MGSLLLTTNNIRALKKSLSAQLPGVGSSHLSEAITASMGFRTYAALCTVTDKQTVRPSIGQPDNDRFRKRLSELGHAPGDVSVAASVKTVALPDRIWFVHDGRNLAPLNRWFRECTDRDIPHVYITPRRKYARVDWDCISLHPRHDEVTSKPDDATLVRRLYSTFQDVLRGKSTPARFDGSSFVGHIDKVPTKDAPALAEAVFKVLYEAVGQTVALPG